MTIKSSYNIDGEIMATDGKTDSYNGVVQKLGAMYFDLQKDYISAKATADKSFSGITDKTFGQQVLEKFGEYLHSYKTAMKIGSPSKEHAMSEAYNFLNHIKGRDMPMSVFLENMAKNPVAADETKNAFIKTYFDNYRQATLSGQFNLLVDPFNYDKMAQFADGHLKMYETKGIKKDKLDIMSNPFANTYSDLEERIKWNSLTPS